MQLPTGTDGVDDQVERFAFTALLHDGTAVRLRPIAPKDRPRLAKGWEGLSATSRYMRFMRNKESLSERELSYLTEIDYSDHFAWAADAVDSTQQSGLGIARYVRVDDEPDVAEAAVAVVDEYQRRGLGRLLLEALAGSAKQNGISRFRAYVSGTNRRALDALTAAGADRVGVDDGLFVMELSLPESDFAESALYAALRAAAIDYASHSPSDGWPKEGTTHHG